MTFHSRWFIASWLALALALAGCALQPSAEQAAERARPAMPAADIQARLLALDPEHITDAEVRDVLAKGPAPRIILIHGGVFPVHLVMESFGHFLAEMGYPETRIRDPGTGSWSYSPYARPSELAGLVAWQYEHDGMRPMMIGHSQGGLSVVKILKELAGETDTRLRVFDPVTQTLDERTTIVDPVTGRTRPALGVSVSYASAIGAGGWALILPFWWEDLDTLRKIPDTVDDFTGYFIELDLFALSIPGNPLDKRYEADGTAHVRNVVLPATYNHVVVPVTSSLATDPVVRRWIDNYVPDRPHDASALPLDAAGHVLWAADVWYSIKKHWCLEAQNWVRTHRAQSSRAPSAAGVAESAAH